MESAFMLANEGAHGGEWWPIFPLLWFALIAGAIFFFGKRARRGMQQHPYLSGQAVLAERYARGEISEQEYQDRLKVLKQER
ncbi:MAG: SHOCT domain-containing protein [Actinomycetota bacterium]